MARAVHRPAPGTQGPRAVRPDRRRARRSSGTPGPRARGWSSGWTASRPRPRRTASTSPSDTSQPKSDDALRAMAEDGVERAVAFTQYPQFSCSTTGSSLNELWRAAERTGLRDAFEWSIIDRWPVHDGFIAAMTETVREGLEQFDPADRDRVLILFSAHSLPLDVIDRGDAYPQEIGASVQAVVERLGRAEPLPAGLPVGGRARSAGSGPSTEQVHPATGRARPEARAGGSDRVHQRPHRDAVGAGSRVRRGGAPGGDHPLQADTRPQRAAAVHRRAGGHRARASRAPGGRTARSIAPGARGA